MPAKSSKQRKLMAAARSAKRAGKCKSASPKVRKVCLTMSDTQLSEFMRKSK